jgi:hypothetical protein
MQCRLLCRIRAKLASKLWAAWWTLRADGAVGTIQLPPLDKRHRQRDSRPSLSHPRWTRCAVGARARSADSVAVKVPAVTPSPLLPALDLDFLHCPPCK